MTKGILVISVSAPKFQNCPSEFLLFLFSLFSSLNSSNSLYLFSFFYSCIFLRFCHTRCVFNSILGSNVYYCFRHISLGFQFSRFSFYYINFGIKALCYINLTKHILQSLTLYKLFTPMGIM